MISRARNFHITHYEHSKSNYSRDLTLISLSVYWPVEGIFGGHDTTINRHPWQVSLQHNGIHFCGAAIINPQWLLTSAQCGSKYTDLSIRAGSNYTNKDGELYKVNKIIIHPEYNEQTYDSDLALLRLTENITADHAFGAGLPEGKFPVLDGASADITGWGYNSSSNKESPDEIQFAQLPIKKLEECRENYAGRTFTENMLCAGFNKIAMTACDGDFGGPVLVSSRLGGILSWGGSCGDEKHPSVFVVVSPFVKWIKDNAIYG